MLTTCTDDWRMIFPVPPLRSATGDDKQIILIMPCYVKDWNIKSGLILFSPGPYAMCSPSKQIIQVKEKTFILINRKVCVCSCATGPRYPAAPAVVWMNFAYVCVCLCVHVWVRLWERGLACPASSPAEEQLQLDYTHSLAGQSAAWRVVWRVSHAIKNHFLVFTSSSRSSLQIFILAWPRAAAALCS